MAKDFEHSSFLFGSNSVFIEELDLEITPITGQNETAINQDDVADVSNKDDSDHIIPETANSAYLDQSSITPVQSESESRAVKITKN